MWCLLDFETTGLIAKENRIIEAGWVLYDEERRKPLSIRNELVWDTDYPVLLPLIKDITGLQEDELLAHGIKPRDMLFKLMTDIVKCSHVVAHNAPFDKGFLEEEFRRQDIALPVLDWIDTSKHLPYPKSIQTRKLTHLCAEHGFVNILAHRAVTDVLSMLKIIQGYDPNQIIEMSKSKTIKIKAMVTRETKDLAKDRGYRWDSPQIAWFKEILESQLNEEIRESPFKVVVIEHA